MKKPFHEYLLIGGCVLTGLLLVAALIIPTMCRVSSYSPRSLDVANLRQLGQASIIYAVDNNECLPVATDVWDYARLLAGILNDGTYWQSPIDPATANTAREKIDVLLPPSDNRAPRALNPAFRAIKPTLAVALGKLHMGMPSTTPILWTRGLQPDGTWAPHSPYGTHGGYIMFLSGNVSYYRNLTDDGGQLIDRNGNKTANILAALPTGVRIGEYMPTPEERRVWSAEDRKLTSYDPRPRAVWPWTVTGLVVWLPFIGISIYRYKTTRIGFIGIFIWPIVITLLLLMLMPTVSH